MKTTIFYFTGTGNSLKVARDLAGQFPQAEIISIPRVINNENIDLSADRIGLVYPVYMFGMPLIVTDFIKKFKGIKGKYIFSIATYGGKAADTLGQNDNLLKAEGLSLSAGFLVKMPGNYTPLYGAISEEKQKEMFLQEEKRVKEIAQIIKEGKPSKLEKDMFLFRGLFSFIYKLGSPRIVSMDSGFWVDDRCNSCAVCEHVCPVYNIKLTEGKPVWLHQCQQCMACLQWCPQEAIQYQRSTITRRRYRNPYIKLEELNNAI